MVSKRDRHSADSEAKKIESPADRAQVIALKTEHRDTRDIKRGANLGRRAPRHGLRHCIRHSWRLPQPVNLDVALQRLELRIGGYEFSLLLFCQRSSEGIGQTQFEARFEISGGIGQGAGGGM